MAKLDKNLKFIKAGHGTVVNVANIDRASAFDNGVGLLNASNDMIGWIDTYTAEQSEKVVDIMLELMNNPAGAQQPDWSFIVDPEGDGTAFSIASVRDSTPLRQIKNSGAADTF